MATYEPGPEGESPLAALDEWVNTTCPKCHGKAKRETDTMPQWAGSSWYFLRYCDPHNKKELASKEALEYWMPVDWYNGGMEHTTLHLLYSRFWAKFLYDIDILKSPEPYNKRTSHGMILGENGEKMSKSRGNVVNPDDIIREYGADTMRLYEMFIGDFEQAAPWCTNSIKGCKRFLDRFAALTDIAKGRGVTPNLEASFHRTIKKVTSDIEGLKFNTAIAAMMALINEIYEEKSLTLDELSTFTKLLSPFAPHLAEEIYSNYCENDGFVSLSDLLQIQSALFRRRLYAHSAVDRNVCRRRQTAHSGAFRQPRIHLAAYTGSGRDQQRNVCGISQRRCCRITCRHDRSGFSDAVSGGIGSFADQRQ